MRSIYEKLLLFKIQYLSAIKLKQFTNCRSVTIKYNFILSQTSSSHHTTVLVLKRTLWATFSSWSQNHQKKISSSGSTNKSVSDSQLSSTTPNHKTPFVNSSSHTTWMTTVFKFTSHPQRTQAFQQESSWKEVTTRTVKETFTSQKT